MRKRPIKISLRLNEQEHEHLKQQAMLSGFPMEVFLRALISGMNLRSRPLAEYAEIRRQLAGIGNNINQIAHVVNTRGFNLPQTGGHGTWMYGVAGTVLMVAAAIILVSARRKKLGK